MLKLTVLSLVFLCSLNALHDLLSWFSKEATEENGRPERARKPSTQINSLSLQPGTTPAQLWTPEGSIQSKEIPLVF